MIQKSFIASNGFTELGGGGAGGAPCDLEIIWSVEWDRGARGVQGPCDLEIIRSVEWDRGAGGGAGREPPAIQKSF